MKESLLLLAPSDLKAISLAIDTRRLSPPYLAKSVERFVRGDVAPGVAAAMQELDASGMTPVAIARSLELLALGLSARPPLEDLVDLVTTGQEIGGVTNRDTSVVVQDLFRRAKDSVLVAGYAIHQGRHVFRTLADRMLERSGMKVQFFLDVQRKIGDTTSASEIVQGFANRFRTSQWPIDRPIPEIFYDPRSLAAEPKDRAALHAKCIVADEVEVFVSSANFTEAAQGKNIEVGLSLHSSVIAGRIRRFFHSLLEHKRFVRVL